MRNIKLVGLAAGLALVAVSAQAAEPALQVSYPSDAGLDCAGVAAEFARVDQAIAQANADIASADGAARGAGLAGTVAVEGMLRTGLLGRAPGLGSFANQAANAAKQRAAARQQQAADQIRVAETRRALLTGLSSGKNCGAAADVPPPQVLPTAEAAAGGGGVVPSLPAEATRHY